MQLDRSNEFVNGVFHYMNGDMSMDACTAMLAHYEEKWDLVHVAPALQMQPKAGATGQITTAPEAWTHIVSIPDDAEVLWNTLVFERYFGFLSDTQLVFQPMVLGASFDVVFSNSYALRATPRSWGRFYAKWANQIRWLGRDDWDKIDFVIIDIASDYWDWAETALEIVRVKTLKGIKPKGWD